MLLSFEVAQRTMPVTMLRSMGLFNPLVAFPSFHIPIRLHDALGGAAQETFFYKT